MKYYILLLILLLSCKSNTQYELIRGNLYSDEKGNLYIKTIDNTQENLPKEIYISTIFLQRNENPFPISEIVDKNSYQQLEKSNYSKDKNYVYFLRETLEGGYFYVLDSLPNDFKLIKKNNVIYGSSKNKFYYNGEPLDIDVTQTSIK